MSVGRTVSEPAILEFMISTELRRWIEGEEVQKEEHTTWKRIATRPAYYSILLGVRVRSDLRKTMGVHCRPPTESKQLNDLTRGSKAANDSDLRFWPVPRQPDPREPWCFRFDILHP